MVLSSSQSMAAMDEAFATPRQEAAFVTEATLARANALEAAGEIRDAVLTVLVDAHSQFTAKHSTSRTLAQPAEPALLPAIVGGANAVAPAHSSLVDAGELVFRSMLRLRAKPWVMLSLDASIVTTEDEKWDKAVRGAFKKLALVLHPDKSQWPSESLFASLYAAYQCLATAASRATWRKQRADEAIARKAARAAGGNAAAEAFDLRQSKERARLERELLQQWRATQQDTFQRWGADDFQAASAHAARDKNDRTRQKQSLAQKQRRQSQQAAHAAKREDLQRAQSAKLQRELEAQARDARSAMAALDMERKSLEAARAHARAAKGSVVVRGATSRGGSQPSSDATRNNEGQVQQVVASTRKPKSSRKPSPDDSAEATATPAGKSQLPRVRRRRPRSGMLPSLPGRTTPEEDNSQEIPDAVSWEPVTAVFFQRGPLGFTLADMSALQMGSSYDANEGDAANSTWSAQVLRIESDEDGHSAAGEQDVRSGDVLIEVNGRDMRDMSFAKVCSLLGGASFPRKLLFRRPS